MRLFVLVEGALARASSMLFVFGWRRHALNMNLERFAPESYMKTAHRICAYLMVALGTVHVAFTPFAYRNFTPNTLWFIGAGLAIVVAGFLNIVSNRDAARRDRVARYLCVATNITFTLLFAIAIFDLPEPQVFFGCALFACATVASYMSGDDDNHRNMESQ